MKKYIYSILLGIVATGFAVPAVAQESTLLHFMRQSPQSLRSNPANISDSVKYFLGIPVLSNINVDFKSAISYGDAIVRTAKDSLRINPDLPNELTDKSRINFGVNVELISFGFRFAQKNMITFSAGVRSYGNFLLPKDAAVLAIQGNDPGRPLVIETDARGVAYAEAALGYSRIINKNWKAGVRVKYLIGAAGADCDKIHATVNTSPVDYTMTLTSAGLVRTSMPDQNNISIQDMLKNRGFGFDAGVYYKTPVKGLEVSLSFIDWGFIDWSTGLKNYESKIVGGEYVFRGLEKLDQNSIDNIIDTLKNVFKFEEQPGEKFRSTLPGKIFLGVSYNLTPKDKFGFLFNTHALHNFEQTRFGVMYNRSVGQWFSVAVGNNFYTDQAWSPCLGMNFRLSGFQLYLVAENINSFKATEARALNVQFGMNVTIFKKATDGQMRW